MQKSNIDLSGTKALGEFLTLFNENVYTHDIKILDSGNVNITYSCENTIHRDVEVWYNK